MVKYKTLIIILSTIAVLFFIAGTILCFSSFSLLREHPEGAIGFLLLLILSIILFAVSVVTDAVSLSLSVSSYKKSEDKRFPLVTIIINSVVLLAIATIVIVVLVLNANK